MRLCSALVAGPAPDEVEGQLHFLKGSALNLGFAELAAICQDGETAGGAGHAAAVDLARCAAIYRASREALLDGLLLGRLRDGRRRPVRSGTRPAPRPR